MTNWIVGGNNLRRNEPFVQWRQFTSKTRMQLVASFVRLILLIVLFSGEMTNLNMKASWQSILVLVLK